MLPPTTERVARSTRQTVNEAIRRSTEEKVRSYARRGPWAIDARLEELDGEWDMERTLEANAATAVLLGMGLGVFVHRRFLAVPVLVAGFLLQHALQGWGPPVPFFRRRGFRTAKEINEERYALKALRGDFNGVAAKEHGRAEIEALLQAVRR
jgi:hypothetical protein